MASISVLCDTLLSSNSYSFDTNGGPKAAVHCQEEIAHMRAHEIPRHLLPRAGPFFTMISAMIICSHATVSPKYCP